jgi:DNA polymerase-4
MGILREFAPHVEPVSLDEAFLDLTGCDRVHGVRGTARGASWLDAAEGLHREVPGARGSRCRSGSAARRPWPVPRRRWAIRGAAEVPRGRGRSSPTSLSRCWFGVGPKMREALARYTLLVVGDLARLPEELLDETFGKAGVALSRRARGLDDGEVRDGRPGPQSISRETSFPDDTSDRAVIGGMLSYLAQRATAALRSERLRAGAVGIRLRYADFRTVEVRRRLSSPSDRDRDVLALVSEPGPSATTAA